MCIRDSVIGDSGLIGALYQEGIAITDKSPDYVIVGESPSYNYETVNKAVSLVLGEMCIRDR